jgi:hypothetical protein
MASLATRGGTTIKNRILSGATEEKKCPFSVMAYETENPGTYKAYIESGEINFKKFDAVEVSISPDCELALSVEFTNDNYEFNSIESISIITNFESSNKTAWATQVNDNGGGSLRILLYIPLAYIYMDTSTTPSSIAVKQYFCDNVDFRLYYTAINGKVYVEFFKIIGLTPGEVPMPASSP